MTSEFKQKPPVDELKNNMQIGLVREKGVVEIISTKAFNPKTNKSFPITSLRFRVTLSDEHSSYRCSFDPIHYEAFDVGDTIGFEFKQKGEFYHIGKRHSICNITRTKGGKQEVTSEQLRPRDEIIHLIKKCDKRFREIQSSLAAHPHHQTKLVLEREKKEVLKLGGLAHLAATGELPKLKESDPRESFENCTIVTRYFGHETFTEILDRAEKRLSVVSSTVEQHQNSVEYIELQKLICALKWILLKKTFDTDLGLNFSWNIFSRKLKDDYTLHGDVRDEYLVKERRATDERAIKEDTMKALQDLHDAEQKSKLLDKFPHLAKHKEKLESKKEKKAKAQVDL